VNHGECLGRDRARCQVHQMTSMVACLGESTQRELMSVP
jgi:hypothetical protein